MQDDHWGNVLKPVAADYRQQNARPTINGEVLENAFWDKKNVCGRPVTTAEVFKAYRSETNSVRSGYFSQKLYLRQVPHQGRQMTVEAVIAEFNRKRDLQSRCCYAVARIKADCCLKGISINGKPVSSDEAADSFPDTPSGKLALNRFREDCWMEKIPVHGQLVSADSVVKNYMAVDAKLELARFREVCCRKNIPIEGRAVSTESVVNSYRAINARQELARFKQICCFDALPINGQQVSPKEVISLFRAAGDLLGLACFRRECCLMEFSIAGQLVTPESVIKSFQALGARLEEARFLDVCYWKGMNIGRQPISADQVANSLQAVHAHLELARFKASCYLEDRLLRNRPVTPEMVVDSFPTDHKGKLGLAHFKAGCCLKGLPLHGRPISPEEVLRHFSGHQLDKLASNHFIEECFLRNILVNGRQVTAESVLRGFPDTADGRLSRAHFREMCCLKGLHISGHPVTPESVMKSFPDGLKGLMGLNRFKEKCLLRGWTLSGRPVNASGVLASFPNTPMGKLAAGRFLENCLFRGLTLGGQTVTAERVFQAFHEHALAKACFQAECCLRSVPLHGRLVTTDEAVAAYPHSLNSQKQLIYFKWLCCLNNLPLAGKLIQPEQVVHLLEQRNQLLDKACFLTELALQARMFNGNYLSNDQVLGAFDQLKGNYVIKKVYFLIQRLIALPAENHNQERQATFEQAWQILADIPIQDDKYRYQRCVMLFLAMKYALSATGLTITPDLVWQSIRELRDSFCNSRLRFYFLADCCCTGTALNGQPVSEQQVLKCLEKFPPRSRLRSGLGYWFEELLGRPGKSDTLNHMVRNEVHPRGARRVKRTDVYTNDPLAEGRNMAVEHVDNPVGPGLINSQTRKVLNVVRGISGLCLTGSFSRWLQGLGSSFHDIDIMASREAIATMIARLKSALDNQEQTSEIPCKILACEVPGCPQLLLNPMFTITMSEGDLGQKVSVVQASVYSPETIFALNTTTATIPGEQGTITCLAFFAEIEQLNNTLQYLADQLDDLTAQLLNGPGFAIPRTILFNYPQHPRDRVFGLLMRCLFSLNKAKQFSALVACSAPAALLTELQTRARCLHARLLGHSHREPFMATLNRWLSEPSPEDTYLDSKSDFIRGLLAMISNPAELF